MSEAVANTPSGTGNSPAPSAPSTSTPSAPSKPASPSFKPKGNDTSGQFRNFLRDEPSSSALDDVDDEGEYTAEPENDSFEASTEETEESFEPEAEPTEEDESWLEKIKGHRKLHGVDLENIIEALAEGRIPDELMDVLKLKMKRGDEEWESPLSKARNEGMMHRDYTSKLQAFSTERDEFNAGKDEFIGMLQNWKSEGDKFPKGDPRRGEALLAGLEHLEFPIEEAAHALALRLQKLDKMTPQERALYDRETKLEKESKAFKAEQAKLQQAKSKESLEAATQKNIDFVQTTAHGLFQKANIPITDNVWKLFIDDLRIVNSSYAPGTPITPEQVETAFYSTADKYQNVLSKKQQQAQAPAKGQPGRAPTGQFTSPAREQVAAAGIAQKVQAARKPKSGGAMNSSDFRKKFLGG